MVFISVTDYVNKYLNILFSDNKQLKMWVMRNYGKNVNLHISKSFEDTYWNYIEYFHFVFDCWVAWSAQQYSTVLNRVLYL